MGILNIGFTIGGELNWDVQSKNEDWLNRNIKEFKSSHKDFVVDVNSDISVKEVDKINLDEEAINVSEGIYCLPDSIYINDKFSNKKAHFIIRKQGYKLDVESGFTFHYYAALLDAFIKIVAFKKDIITLHASAIKKEDKVSVFGAWRRMGKTTAILNILAQDNTVQVLADDAVMMTAKGQLIPYLRGIDLYPYLPIPNNYLSTKDKLKEVLLEVFRGSLCFRKP